MAVHRPGRKRGAAIALLAVATTLLTLLLLPVSLGVILWKYLVLRCRTYEVTSQRLCVPSGVFSRRRDELELYRVTDLRIDQPFWLRLLGLSHILLFTSDKTTEVNRIEAVRNAPELSNRLRAAVEECRDRKRVRVSELE